MEDGDQKFLEHLVATEDKMLKKACGKRRRRRRKNSSSSVEGQEVD